MIVLMISSTSFSSFFESVRAIPDLVRKYSFCAFRICCTEVANFTMSIVIALIVLGDYLLFAYWLLIEILTGIKSFALDRGKVFTDPASQIHAYPCETFL
jgi:hypothetical protein